MQEGGEITRNARGSEKGSSISSAVEKDSDSKWKPSELYLVHTKDKISAGSVVWKLFE